MIKKKFKSGFLTDFQNLLDYQGNASYKICNQKIPYDQNWNYFQTNQANVFSDQGAWFGYYLPKEKINAFHGPMLISQEVPLNLSSYIAKPIFKINHQKVVFEKALEFTKKALPGKLLLKALFRDYEILQELIFINDQQALVSWNIKNLTSQDVHLEVFCESKIHLKIVDQSIPKNEEEGRFLKQYFSSFEIKNNLLIFHLDSLVNTNYAETFVLKFPSEVHLVHKEQKENVETILLNVETLTLKGNSEKKFFHYEEFFFQNHKPVKSSFLKEDLENEFLKNKSRWEKYLKIAFKNIDAQNLNQKGLITKAIMILIANWLAPNGKLKHDTIVPSITFRGFLGAYAWDIWKIASGVAIFDVNLAQNVFQSIFDYQIEKDDQVRPQDHGMVPDCIFYNFPQERKGKSRNWNERNTKPPLAAWSAWEIANILKTD